jgi:ATP-dependent Lhr-like helicase
VEWERSILPARLANYDPRWLDQLCLSGAVGWGRISPHPAWLASDGPGRPRRVIPSNAAPITFYLRETADWLPFALAQQCVDERLLEQALSPNALRIRDLLRDRGACFAPDLQRISGMTRQETAHGLWELATAGLAAADGFDQLRALMDPRRRSATAETSTKRAARSTAGRWCLFHEPEARALKESAQAASVAKARETDQALESFARMLLARYGVLFRDLLARESNVPRWRDLLGILRRLEARGEVRGGRFVSGFSGEQFALPEAVESLRASRHRDCETTLEIAAADPLNLSGVVFPGERVPCLPNRHVSVRNGLYMQQAGNGAGGEADAGPAGAVSKDVEVAAQQVFSLGV